MNTTLVVILYAAIASFVSAYAFYFGVVARPAVRTFMPADHLILSLTALGVGVAWVLFVPGLTALAAVQIRRHLPSVPVSRLPLGRTEQVGIGHRA